HGAVRGRVRMTRYGPRFGRKEAGDDPRACSGRRTAGGEPLLEADEVVDVEDRWRGAVVAVAVGVDLLVWRQCLVAGEADHEAGVVVDVKERNGFNTMVAVGIALERARDGCVEGERARSGGIGRGHDHEVDSLSQAEADGSVG